MSSRKSAPADDHPETSTAREYWAGKLSGGLGFANLVLDRPRPARHDASSPAAKSEVVFAPDVQSQLERVTGNAPFLLYTALMAALKICLFKYTGSRVVTVGSPARRKQETTRHAPNALPIVDELNGTMTFRELLMRVRETLLEAYAQQSYGYEHILHDLGLESSENQSPLFHVALALENIHESLPELRNDVSIHFVKDVEGFRARVEFNNALFDHAAIERFTNHYQRVLLCGLHNPETKIDDIDLLTESERHEQLVAWNNTATPYPHEASIHRLFEAQAGRTPAAPALVCGAHRLTYAELNERANQLAHYLVGVGVGAEVLVGICVERSVEMVVGILGILKAGGAYVPLDPAYPAERIGYMMENARVGVLVTHSLLAEQLSPDTKHVICLDGDADVIGRQRRDNLALDVLPENAAYVIYTSGSTGRPKGVVVSHRGLCNLTQAQLRAFSIDADSRVLQFASLSFDASVSEVFTALTAGATLCVPSPETPLYGDSLIDLLQEKAITTVTLPPSALAAAPDAALPHLRTIIVAGEACPPQVVARWSPGRRFLNAYGPTEATVCATICEDPNTEDGQPTIGRPIANAAVYLLDEGLRPVPVGVAAELHIGGAGLARGYLHHSALTAERFIPDPFAQRPGSRLYKTGDVARYRADGEIEFIGRVDHQVKVRGYRIETGEVEAALMEHGGVRQCVVVAREDGESGKRLVAYVVVEDAVESTGAEVSEWREWMARRVPEYMIPAVYVRLEEMPLTANGKVDRNALPSPEAMRRRVDENPNASSTPVEEVLTGIWGEVLGLAEVGVDENFFELGGHSLLATRVFSRLREAFNVDLPIKTLFDAPTIAQLARHVEVAMGAESAIRDLLLQPVPRDEALPLSFGQQRMWFLYQLDPTNTLYNIPIALRLTGQLDLEVLERTLREIIRRHEALRTTFKMIDGRPVQVISCEQSLNLSMLDMSALPEGERGERVYQLAAEEAQRPFDLAQGPLMRVGLIRLGADEHVLLFTMHHIVSDGWSLGVLINEVAVLYDSYLNKVSSPLPELPIQYADYAYWQREWLQGAALENQIAYWRGQLDGAPTTLELASGRVRPSVQSNRGALEHRLFSKILTTELKALGRREGVTLFMTLLAAFQTVLYRYSGQEKLVVGSPIANRNRREVEGLIGFFLNVLALRIDMSGNPSFRELLGRVREVALGAYAHQDVPFEKLVGELQLERELSYAPLFQAVFVLQNMPMAPLSMSGLTIERLDVQRGTTQSDLYFSMTETEHGMSGTLKYNTTLYDAELIARMMRDYETLLTEVAARPELRLLDIPLSEASATDYATSGVVLQNRYRDDQFVF